MITRELPCSPIVDGTPSMFRFTGIEVGPFFIHRDWHDGMSRPRYGGWSVSHSATGYAVQKEIRTKAAAMKLARELAKLDCWGFMRPEQVKGFPEKTLIAIRRLKDAA